jgi:DNA/RNA endonuclease YhcR with UshA esterase domain
MKSTLPYFSDGTLKSPFYSFFRAFLVFFLSFTLWSIGIVTPTHAQTDTLATWELSGIVTTNWGASPLPAQQVSTALSTSGWTRGPGVLFTAAGVATTGSPAGNAWGGNGWDGFTPSGAGSIDSAISRGDFVSISFDVVAGQTVSFAGIPAYNIRRSSSGPTTGQWQYSTNPNGTFINIGSPITWGAVTTGTGNPQPAIDLSTISDLQNLGGGTTITFRIVNTGASGSGGTWYINQLTTAGRDITFMGSVGGGSSSTTLTLGAVTPGLFCTMAPGQSTVSANYTSTGTLTGPVELQLSNAQGSFASPTALGSSSAASGTITATLPSGLPNGTGYAFRLVSGSTTSAPSSSVRIYSTPAEASSFTAVPGDGIVTLTWTNPSDCFDQALVAADISAINGVPTGNIFITNPVFGSGANLNNGYVVFASSGNSVTVSGLTNGTNYHFKVFTQSGNTWSSGVSIQATPFASGVLPISNIGSFVGTDSLGVLSNLGTRYRITGVVHGINQYRSSSVPLGTQFIILDQTGGITVRRAGTNFGISGLAQGDSVVAEGVLEQFNGLAQLNIDTMIRISTGNALYSPQVVNTVSESTENRRIRVNNLYVLSGSWPTTGNGNLVVTNGTDTLQLFILSLTNIPGTTPPAGLFDVIGYGGQYDASSPFTSGYQLQPHFSADIIPVSVATPTLNFTRVDTFIQNAVTSLQMTLAIQNPRPTAQSVSISVNASAGAAYGTNWETFPSVVGSNLTLPIPANANSVSFSLILYGNIPVGRLDTMRFTISSATGGYVAGPLSSAAVRVGNPTPPVVPEYAIGTIRGNDNGGVADSINVNVRTRGIVIGLNKRPPGLEFHIFDKNSNMGIGVFRNTGNLGYTVREGDSILIQGIVAQFNGLSQINVDQITLLDSNRVLPLPQLVTAMSEQTESRLIQMNNLTMVTPSQWPTPGTTGSGRTVQVTDGISTFDIRIDADVSLFGTPAPTGPFNMIGIGGQFTTATPRIVGYQLMPRYLSDLLPVVVSNTINGSLRYDNTAQSPLTNSIVQLMSGTTIVQTDTTSSTGSFTFDNLPDGAYSMVASTTKPWGGVNATDALNVARHFSNTQLLTGMRITAADVNGSTSINSTDALNISRRTAAVITSFSVGNWYFESPQLSLSGGTTTTQNIRGICFGDVNGSYSPALRNAPTVSFSDGAQVSGHYTLLPVSTSEDMNLGAVTLIMDIPQGLAVTEIKPAALNLGSFVSNIVNGQVLVSWYSLEEVKARSGAVLFNLVVRHDGKQSISAADWSVHQNSELANGWAQPYPSANLKIGRLSTSDNQSLLFPNPSIGSAQLQVSLLESSKISIQILDLTGRLIQIINQQRSAGVHVLDLPNMAAGQYLVRMSLDSEHSSATEIHRWVVQP